MKQKRVLLLGSTGSIGKSTIDVIAAYPERFTVSGLSAHTNLRKLKALAARFPNAKTALTGPARGNTDEIDFIGPEAAVALIRETEADIVVNGIIGAAGLLPSFAAVEAGMDVALANKESVVMAGELLLPTAAARGVNVLPVDSEHAAIFQLLKNRPADEISQLILTASGGPFRKTPLDQLEAVTVEQALNHPTWNMGAKISIDSATMANKGLEVIEAVRFFSVTPDEVQVLIHPRSLVHSLIRTRDGVMYAQVSSPDMRNPIVNALSYPDLLASDFAPLDLAGESLNFYTPEKDRYPLLWMAYDASRSGGAYPTAYNAANEVAVAAFVERRITYPQIAAAVAAVLERDWLEIPADLEQILDVDGRARSAAVRAIEEIATLCCSL